MSQKNKYIFTSESVTEGHPDKVCDQISDAVLDACLEGDPDSRVACEVMATTDRVILAGEITTKTEVDYEKVARDTLREIGYTDKKWGISADTCEVMNFINPQSPDIAMGVNKDHEDPYETVGAGDQGMMFGYACKETPEYMPFPIALAHRITRRLAEARKSGEIEWLRPDGKAQVSVEYEDDKPKRVTTIVVSTQHAEDVSNDEIVETIKKEIVKKVVPAEFLDDQTSYFINPTGKFVIGGPEGDAGLTGRKIIVDTYGGYARHGGGAFSGKDPSKVDRSGAYTARYIAKNIVAAGLAERVEVQLAYAIGVTKPVSVLVETFGTSSLSQDELEKIVNDNFDLRPAAIIDKLDLKRPIYRKTASYGHFGRSDLDLPWEKVGVLSKVGSA